MAAAAKKKIGVVTAAALIGAVLIVATPNPAQACTPFTRKTAFEDMRNGNMETVTLRTFNIDVTYPKRAAIGSVATIKALVTRPAKEDPLGQGIPMDRPFVEPAPDVIVGVGLSIGNVFLPGAAITNEQGIAKVKIMMQAYAPANKTVHMSVYAWKVAQQTPCLTVQEDGYEAIPNAFRTTD